jgi:hypothetical protein
MYARVTTTTGQAKKDEVVRVIRERIVPRVEDFQGFKGSFWLFDEKTGKGLAISLWDSQAALDASARPIEQMRNQAVGELRSQVESVESFEVIVTAGVPAGVSA